LRTWASPTPPKRASTRFCTTSISKCTPAKCWRWSGPSGAGKSTLVNLIPRFFDVTFGRILIDGHDMRDLTLGSLRRQVAQVTQETILFNDTVRNNIAYGQPDVKGLESGGSRPRKTPWPTTSSCACRRATTR
jgi:ABC-type cobalamin/Fe3+-siderophores transport system ATPase subunit